MLVLSRKPGEKVHVGRDVVFTVLEVQAGRVRIGIDAPTEVPILRAELPEETAEPRNHARCPAQETNHASERS